MHNLCDWLPWAGKNALLQEDDHTNCLMKWYQSQQEKHLWPSCPHCRADPPPTVLEALGVHPSPPTPFHWETAQNHIEYWNYTWDESIPIERDVFFYNIFRKGYRIILCCMERIVDCIWSRFIDMRIEEYREAIALCDFNKNIESRPCVTSFLCSWLVSNGYKWLRPVTGDSGVNEII